MIQGAVRETVDTLTSQYSLTSILLIWASVSLPMFMLAWVIAPRLIPLSPLHPGITFWLLMILGMIWQLIVSVVLLVREGQEWSWTALKRRLWLSAPLDPFTSRPRRDLWWWVIPCLLFSFLSSQVVGSPLDSVMNVLLPGFQMPTHADIASLNNPQFSGQWWILGVALLSAAFNYFLGEELLFRGVLLPRMRGVFGKWDWLANAVLFGFYHLHKPWAWPSIILSSLAISWPAARFKSNWLAVAVHGAEGVFMTILIVLVLNAQTH